ncbi:hypothetical protein AVEN_82430-1 [Araneus ventricosus]|uniref:Uncharacterized protein n=1 Tax=Araneus ventricosus TaxID=182803 RepID=A0A4Y2GWP4_ARAVE|nr:hypothetical protein AVEN_82430-1 [Araneus ventricosus]
MSKTEDFRLATDLTYLTSGPDPPYLIRWPRRICFRIRCSDQRAMSSKLESTKDLLCTRIRCTSNPPGSNILQMVRMFEDPEAAIGLKSRQAKNL